MERPIDLYAKVTVEVGDKVETQHWINPLITKKYNSNSYFVFRDSLREKVPDYIREKFEEEETEIKSVNGRMR